ncbi:MAG: autotransporter-associated beta strand repeat-containing protein, partial [Verrucomicrobiae bacterium]|nr:autotransporter-associated beta strand repeat-containing protein [Verrucomicrobiae bacterium]
ALAGAATIDSSSGVTINGAGAKLMVSNFAAGNLGATTPVLVTQGAVDGNGSIDSLTVADDPANTVQAGAGNLGDLTVNTLVFQGDAQITLQATGEFMDQVIYATDLTTTGASGKVTVNVTNTLNAWSSDASGFDYPIIDYAGGTFTGSISDFQVGSVPDLNPNQSASIVDTGSAIVLRITGEPLIWVGNDGATWDTSNSSWDYQGSGTMFSANSPVEFNDDADEFVVEIGENVSPSVTLFSNSIDYTLNSSGGFGIAGGSVVKNGFGTVTLSTVNTYDGTTTINEGEILLTGNGSISDSSTITVGASGELTFDVTGNSEYANPIAGSGLITKGGTGTVTLSGANTHTGDLYLNEGGLNLNSVSALGAGPGIFTINGGTIDNTSGADLVLTGAKPIFWDGDFSFTGTNSLALGGGAVTMGGSGTSRTVNVDANSLGMGAITGTGFGLVKTGAGTLVTNGIVDLDGILDIQGGIVSANQDVIAAAPMGSGILQNEGDVGTKWTFWDGNADPQVTTDYTSNVLIRDNDGSHQFQLGIVKRGTGSLTLTNASNNTTAQLQVVSGKLVLDAGTYKYQNIDTSTFVGAAALIGSAAANGVLVIDGATVHYNNMTNADAAAYRGTLNIGANATGAGAVMLSSGSLDVHRQLAVGSTGGSFAAYSQSGGTATVGGFLAVGLGTAQGVVNLSGGTYNQGGPVTNGAGTGSTGVMSLSGNAAYNQTSVGDLGLWIGESGTGVLNVSDSSTLTIVSGNNGLQLGRNASGVGSANLLGGTVTAKAVYKGAGTGSLSFNGGTLAANTANTAFLTGLTSAYVHAGGGTIHNGGNAITIGQPLLAPTGGGVTATGLIPGGSGFIDTPIVTVTGDGTGASAVAEIDASGNLTGITMTNPGVGYTNATFALLGGGIGNTGAIDGAPTIVPNVSGGMTFSGSATTTLTGVNTYTGNTTITAGTLVVGTGGAVTVKPTANNTSSKITGAGTLSFIGTLRIDLSGAAIANGNSWLLEDVASPFYTPGSFAVTSASLGAFTEQGDGVTHILVDGNNTWSFSETTGVLSLSVAAPSGFDSWITGFGLDPADQDPTDDPDNDGVSNLVEYVLGRDPSVSEGAASTGAKNGANFELTFQRADLAQAAGDVSILIEYGNDLAGWTEVAVPATSGTVGGVTFTITDGSPTDTVVASIPTSGATEFFARVKAVK